MNHIEIRRFGVRQLWIGLLICIGVFAVLGVRAVRAAEIECSAVNYCETEIDLSDQKAPIVYDGTGNWLDAFEKYFDADVFLVSGSGKKPVSDAALIFACSVDGVAFDSCQAGQFIEPGTYTLRVSVEEDTERFYLPVYCDTKVTISEAAADDRLTIAYRADGAESGTAVEDWTEYRRGDKAVISGNFGIASDGSPDPLVRSGFVITGWREAGGRTYGIGEEIVMENSIELTPIWTSEAAALSAPVASFASAEPTQTAPGAGSNNVDETLLAKAATFYPVRADGGKSEPILLAGAKALTSGMDGIQTWNPHVLDGFYAPDGSEVSLALGNPIPSEPNSAAEMVAESMDADAATGTEDSAYDGADAPVSLSEALPDALTESPFDAMPLPEEDFAGSGAAKFPDAAAETPAETLPIETAPDSAPQLVSERTSALPADTDPVAGADAGHAVQAKLPLAAAPVPGLVPNDHNVPFDPGDKFVVIPQTGFARLNNAPAMALPSTGMQLELPIANITAEIVVVPFAENTWDVSSLRSQVGVLEGFDLPGDGVSILAGHNHLGPDQAGPFLTIGTLETGDRIFVRKGDGTILTFEVYENRLVAPDEFETIETLTVPNPGSIVLVTCENESLDGGYTDRRAIFARPVDG